MSWFDEQIRLRKENDDRLFEESFEDIANAVLGKSVNDAFKDAKIVNLNAISSVIDYYNGHMAANTSCSDSLLENVDFQCRANEISYREVTLDKGWSSCAVGAMLLRYKEDGTYVAAIPSAIYGYSFYDEKRGKKVRINARNEKLFERDALAFYSSLPLRGIGLIDLVKYGLSMWNISDYVIPVLMMAVITGLGLLVTRITNFVFADVIEIGKMRLLVSSAIFLLCINISSQFISSVNGLIGMRGMTKMSKGVEAAIMKRVLSLPTGFFKEYSSGDVLQRTQYLNDLCDTIVSMLFSTCLSSVFSLCYITQINKYAPELVIPSIFVTVATVVISVLSTLIQIKISKAQMELSAKERGMSFAMIRGIQKIKLAGAEKRAFARWASLYAKEAQLTYNPPTFLKINKVITTAITLLGNIVVYYYALNSDISTADYYTFNTAYAYLSGAFVSLAGIALQVAGIKPICEMVKPILEAVPECSEKREMVGNLSGSIDISNVTFRYNKEMPLVLDNFSLRIKSGQYIAIVGKTGCGKSTLVRLLLGFEKAERGTIYYDGKDIDSIDLRSLRSNIGVVMQNGKLFQGDIYSNIIISSPDSTLDDAWEAARIAQLDKDIEMMPMGMNTLISEGQGGISGGQKQRLMIARAVASKPKILIFDEATSALDNITQRHVSEALDSLKCTRIVIAHRLSTIKHCDRIVYVENGHITEDGTYDELMSKNGAFAELVRRQQINPQS